MKVLLASLLTLSSFSALASEHQFCAVLYNKVDFHRTASFVVRPGEAIPDLNEVGLSRAGRDWDNKLSKLLVRRGCTVLGYQYQEFNMSYHDGRELDGFTRVYENNTHLPVKNHFVDSYANNKISSLKCFCL